MSWEPHLQSLVGASDRQACILTQARLECCATSPGFEISPTEAAQTLDTIKKQGPSIHLQGVPYTVVRYYNDDSNVVILTEKVDKSGAGNTLSIGPKKFVVVALTTTLMFLIKVGPTDNQVDAAEAAEKLKAYLVSQNL